MSYIQDKLDGFHKIFTEYKNIKDGSMDSFFEKYVMIVLEESYNRGKTDYHNHIVEKIKNSDKAFGIIDKDGKGGAILITDIEKII